MLQILRRFSTCCSLFKNETSAQSFSKLQELALFEKCIVVNENDVSIGNASKKDCHLIQSDGSLLLHRAFSVFMFNKNGEMLLQRRSLNKITFPGYVSNACCSHPLHEIPEETDEAKAIGVKRAAKRRMLYELGIPSDQINIDDFEYITRIHYEGKDNNIWGEHEMDYVLFLKKEVDINPNSEEICDIAYVSKENIDDYISQLKSPVTPWFHLIHKHYLHYWWENLNNIQICKDHETINRF